MGAGRGHTVMRVVVTVLLAITLVFVLVFSSLAGPGLLPFTQSTGYISDIVFTCITPAGYTFNIWGLIYACLTLIIVYAVTLLFMHVDGKRAWRLGGAVSVPFMITFIINLNLIIGWLFAWDAINTTSSTVLLLLVAITNTIAISLLVYYFSVSAKDLYQKSRGHFWANILVINGYGFYNTWTTIAALINLTAFFRYQVELMLNNICIGVLIILLVGFLLWFIVENTWLATMANPIITHYMVLVWATIGAYVEQKKTASNEVLGLILSNLSVGATMLGARVAFIIYRNWGNKIYGANVLKDSPIAMMDQEQI